MATMSLAMWLQDADPNGNRHLIILAIGLIAFAIAAIAVVMVVIAIKAMRTVRELGETVEAVKAKMLPLMDEVFAISRTTRVLLEDAAPKVKIISENLVKTSDTLVDTSRIARGAVQQMEVTISDANRRAQRQVARVDGMVSAALTTTAEVADTISNGIRVPAQKLAEMVHQAKTVAEGLVDKVKRMTAGSPFGSGQRP